MQQSAGARATARFGAPAVVRPFLARRPTVLVRAEGASNGVVAPAAPALIQWSTDNESIKDVFAFAGPAPEVRTWQPPPEPHAQREGEAVEQSGQAVVQHACNACSVPVHLHRRQDAQWVLGAELAHAQTSGSCCAAPPRSV